MNYLMLNNILLFVTILIDILEQFEFNYCSMFVYI